jgi:hypothetical protein
MDSKQLKCLLEVSGFNLAQTAVVSYNGCSKIDTVRVLAQLLRDKAPNLHLVVHRDRDYLAEDEVTRYKGMVIESGAKAFITEYSDIEGHFLAPEHIHAAHPTISVERATEIINLATATSRDASIADIINLRYEQALRLRARGGANPNAGQIAQDANHDFDASPTLMRRGKRVLAQVRLLVQHDIGGHARLEVNSASLASEQLRAIAQVVWPPVAAQE